MGLIAFRSCLGMLVILAMGSPILPVHAQIDDQSISSQPDEPEIDEPLDPDQALTEFPDFGVEWPDLDQDAEPVTDQIEEETEEEGAAALTVADAIDEQEQPASEELAGAFQRFARYDERSFFYPLRCLVGPGTISRR